MVGTVRWSPTAEASFRQVIAYLQTNWSEREAADFVRRTDATVRLVCAFPGMSRKGRKGTREVLVTKHNVMCFRIEADELQIVGFWDARQHPRRRVIQKL